MLHDISFPRHSFFAIYFMHFLLAFTKNKFHMIQHYIFLWCVLTSFEVSASQTHGCRYNMKMQNKETNYRSCPKPEHTTLGLCRSSARAAGCGGAGQNGTPMGRVAQKLTVPIALQSIVDSCPDRFVASMIKTNSYVNRWRNKARG